MGKQYFICFSQGKSKYTKMNDTKHFFMLFIFRSMKQEQQIMFWGGDQ